jgi:hypothetical protein
MQSCKKRYEFKILSLFFMKQFFAFFFLILLFSCNEEDKNLVSKDIDYYQFQKIDLNKYDIPASVYLPDASAGIGTSFKPLIEHEVGDYKWKITVGRYFILNIEDFGDFKYLYEEKKKQIVSNRVYKTKILKEEGTILVYQQTLKEDAGLKKKNTFHIYSVVKLDDVFYQIMNNEFGNSRKEIDFMFKSIKSIKKTNYKWN